MTTFDHRLASGAWFKGPTGTRMALGHRLLAGLKLVQYGQMVSVLNRLPDSHLAEAGLQRSDIPEHARRAVYGDD